MLEEMKILKNDKIAASAAAALKHGIPYLRGDRRDVDALSDYVFKRGHLNVTLNETQSCLLWLKAGGDKQVLKEYLHFYNKVTTQGTNSGSKLRKKVIGMLAKHSDFVVTSDYGCWTQYRVHNGRVESYFNSPVGYNPTGWSIVRKDNVDKWSELYSSLHKQSIGQ